MKWLLEKAMAPHSSTLAWKIPRMEEPGRLQSMGSRRVGHDWATSLSHFHFHVLEKEMAAHSSVLAWRIPGTAEPGGLPSVESHRVGHDWRDLAAAAAARPFSYQLKLRTIVQEQLPGVLNNILSHFKDSDTGVFLFEPQLISLWNWDGKSLI